MTVVNSRDAYPQGHVVFKRLDRWLKGEIIAVLNERRADDRVHTYYTVRYENGEEERVEHEEVKERTRGKLHIWNGARVRKYVPRTGRFLPGVVATAGWNREGTAFYNIEYANGEKEQLTQLETEEILIERPEYFMVGS